jgi:hypothetical protein
LETNVELLEPIHTTSETISIFPTSEPDSINLHVPIMSAYLIDLLTITNLICWVFLKYMPHYHNPH